MINADQSLTRRKSKEKEWFALTLPKDDSNHSLCTLLVSVMVIQLVTFVNQLENHTLKSSNLPRIEIKKMGNRCPFYIDFIQSFPCFEFLGEVHPCKNRIKIRRYLHFFFHDLVKRSLCHFCIIH